jgi:hypothetical protein
MPGLAPGFGVWRSEVSSGLRLRPVRLCGNAETNDQGRWIITFRGDNDARRCAVASNSTLRPSKPSDRCGSFRTGNSFAQGRSEERAVAARGTGRQFWRTILGVPLGWRSRTGTLRPRSSRNSRRTPHPGSWRRIWARWNSGRQIGSKRGDRRRYRPLRHHGYRSERRSQCCWNSAGLRRSNSRTTAKSGYRSDWRFVLRAGSGQAGFELYRSVFGSGYCCLDWRSKARLPAPITA